MSPLEALLWLSFSPAVYKARVRVRVRVRVAFLLSCSVQGFNNMTKL